MCVQIDSVLPIAQISGASVNTKNFTLVSADGAELSAFEANSGLLGSIDVVVFPDVRRVVSFLRGASRQIR